MLDKAATRYYESIATGPEDEDDSEVESTIYDLGNDTQFAFESQEPEEDIRERRVERTSKKRDTTNNGAEGRDNLQFSINKMDLYLFLTVFTAMSILCLLYTSPSPRD